MKELIVNIEKNGKLIKAGTIRGNDYSDAVFCYDDDYLVNGNTPISISLPLQNEPFSVKQTYNFFEGLLPEGFSRKTVANYFKTNEEDYISILEQLGQECLGAIYIGNTSNDSAIEGTYEPLSDELLKSLAAEGTTTSTKILAETHLSLTGATGKVGVYYDEENARWYLPKGTAPSTHIVKQSHVRYKSIVINELICLQTAKLLGINVPDSFIINTGNGKDEDILFATKRYDRILSDIIIDGLQVPYRLHQEDFAQALGIDAASKYETTKKGYIAKMFALISNVSSKPIEDTGELWRRIVFNYLIGNTDSHIKNYSLVYNNELNKIKLAPAYDIVCTTAYNTSNDMSMYVESKLKINEIDKSCFDEAALEAGIGKNIATKEYEKMLAGFENALSEATDLVKSLGYKEADNIKEQILKTGGFQYIS